VLDCKASRPIAVLLNPDVLFRNAAAPIAVLLFPVVLARKEQRPIAILLYPVVRFNKDPLPAAKLFVPVLEELKFVVAPIEMFVETFPPPVLISKLLIEPVTSKDPVIWADPVNGNAAPPALGAYEALSAWVAYEAVPKSDPVNEVAFKK